jgi:hypothetical protein
LRLLEVPMGQRRAPIRGEGGFVKDFQFEVLIITVLFNMKRTLGRKLKLCPWEMPENEENAVFDVRAFKLANASNGFR